MYIRPTGISTEVHSALFSNLPIIRRSKRLVMLLWVFLCLLNTNLFVCFLFHLHTSTVVSLFDESHLNCSLNSPLQRTLGVSSPTAAKLFTILSPVGPYYPEGFNPVTVSPYSPDGPINSIKQCPISPVTALSEPSHVAQPSLPTPAPASCMLIVTLSELGLEELVPQRLAGESVLSSVTKALTSGLYLASCCRSVETTPRLFYLSHWQPPRDTPRLPHPRCRSIFEST